MSAVLERERNICSNCGHRRYAHFGITGTPLASGLFLAVGSGEACLHCSCQVFTQEADPIKKEEPLDAYEAMKGASMRLMDFGIDPPACGVAVPVWMGSGATYVPCVLRLDHDGIHSTVRL